MCNYEEVMFCGHKCLRMYNDTVELFVTIDMGPRILGYNLLGKENLFCVLEDGQGHFEGEEFDNYYWPGASHDTTGGHRIWLAPEKSPETYYPDNTPVRYELRDASWTVFGKSMFFIPEPQKGNDMQIILDVEFMGGSKIKVHHRVTNLAPYTREMAIWGITMMNMNGVELVKHNSFDNGFLPNRKISLWSYSDSTDKRFINTKKYMGIKPDTNAETPFKFGTDPRKGEAVYCSGDQVFICRFPTYHNSERYVDNDCSFESYTSNCVMELETLDCIREFKGGREIDFKIIWEIVDNPGTPDITNDDDIDRFWDTTVKPMLDKDLKTR